MKMTKLTVALAISGFLGLGSVAHAIIAVSGDTYVFEANSDIPDNPTIFDGSTITIDWTGDDGVASFNFVDTDLPGSPFTSGYESVNSVTSYDKTGWSGDFQVSIGSYDFEATGSEMIETTLEVEPSASGTWTYVPDASSTFPMLLGVLAALAGVHYCNRPRVLALAGR